jgi:hypothetical protein
MRAISRVLNGLRIVHTSLGLKREAIVVLILLLPLLFHPEVQTYLAARGVPDWPVVNGTMPALVLAGGYLYWRLLRHAVLFEDAARPCLTARILDPGQRYDTYVALGNRVLRLYHLEVGNTSTLRTARAALVTLVDYRRTGEMRVVDIRSPLKIANSDAEKVDLNPGARVVFELCGVEVNGTAPASAEEREQQTFSILPSGSGSIRVSVEARNTPSRQEEYRVYIDTTGSMTIKPQAEMH